MNAADPGIIAIQAIKRPASERPALLDSVCRGDAELREEVIALIKVYEDSGRFSVDPPAETRAPVEQDRATDTEGPGAWIGRYKLLQQIGEGGFGVVYMAEQHEPVRRKVALKVVKPGMDTGEVVARFEAERQALALMDHPNIAKVLDAGTTDGKGGGGHLCEAPEGPFRKKETAPLANALGNGRPYFVMELVRGVSITEYCDKNHLTTRERLQLFATVCVAVQHAHQKGIIHRDLKPSNILVTLHDGTPVPKVIDFGVAKALDRQLTERTLFTAYGQVVGTPQYMSPEQAEMSGLDVDTRSDIYSLGVLLYELLTGSTPFDMERLRSAGLAEMLRIIREDEPPKPSTRVSTGGEAATVSAKHRSANPQQLCKTLRGELDWIVMKALDKDRNRRYANANGFAADLQRYLNDDPVSACPPSAAYRVSKFVRRHKKTVAAAGAIGIVLLAGVVLSAVMAVRAVDAAREAARRLAGEVEARSDAERTRQAEIDQRRAVETERDRALEAERQATRQRSLALVSEDKAQANFQKARDTVDRYLTTVSENQLLTVPGMQPLRQELLDSARTFYERFLTEGEEDIQLRTGLASVYLRLGEVHRDLQEKKKANEYFAEAQKLFEALVRDGCETPDTLRQLGEVYAFLGRHAESITLCKRVLKERPDDCDAQLLLAATYNTLTIVPSDRSGAELNKILRLHSDAFAIRRQLVELAPDNPTFLGDLSSTINNVGVVLGEQRQEAPALEMFRLGRRYGDAAFARAPHSMRYGRFAAVMRRNVAVRAAAMNSQDEALDAAYQSVVDAWNLLAINNPGIASYKSERYRAYQELAGYQQRIGQQDEAAATLRLARQSVENLPQETASDLYDLAKVYAALARSRGPEQEAMAQLAVKSLARAFAKGYRNVAVLEADSSLVGIQTREDCQRLLAVIKLEQKLETTCKDPENGEEVEGLRVELRQYETDGLAQIPLTRALRTLAGFYERAEEFDKAEQLLVEAVQICESIVEKTPQDIAHLGAIQVALGNICWKSDRIGQSRKHWEAGLDSLRSAESLAPDDDALHEQVANHERTVFQRYGEIGLWELACDHVQRNLRRDRTYDAYWDTRFAHVLAALGHMEEHRQICQLLVEKWGESSPNNALWATAMNPQSGLDAPELLELAEKIIEPKENHPPNFSAATAFYRAGQYERALELMLMGRPRDYVSPTYPYWYAMVDHKLGDHEQSSRMLERAEAGYLKFAHLCLEHPAISAVQGGHGGHWYAWAEDQAMRRQAWNVLRGHDPPEDPWQHLIQARGYRLIGEVEKAEAELAAASAAAPEDMEVCLARARLLSEWGEIERAEAEWQKIVESAGDDPMPWIHRGRWYAERGEHEEADADFAQAASLTPNELNKFLEAGWWIVGPYPPKLDEFCPAEVDPDPSKPVHTMDPETGLSDQPVAWRSIPSDNVGHLNLDQFLDGEGSASYYAMAYVYSPDERCMLLRGGMRESRVRLWVNGAEAAIGASSDTFERIPIVLRKGRNQLLLKCFRDRCWLRMGDAPIDRALTLGEQGRWFEAATTLREHSGDTVGTMLPNSLRRDRLIECLIPTLACSGDAKAFDAFAGEILQCQSLPGILGLVSLCALPHPRFEMRSEEAISIARERVLKNTKPAGDCRHAAVINYRAGNFSEAQEYLDEIPGHAADFTHSLPLRALLCWHRGEESAAHRWLSLALEEFDAIKSAGDLLLPANQRQPFGWPGKLGLFCALLCEAQREITGSDAEMRGRLRELADGQRDHWINRDAAIGVFDHAVFAENRDPEVPRVHLARGNRLAELGRLDEAEADFHRAVGVAPKDPQVLTARAIFYADHGQADRAAADFRDALILSNVGAKGQYWPGLPVYLEVAQRDDVLDRLEALRPDDGHPRMMRMILYIHQGQLDAAMRDAERLEPYGFHCQRAAVALLQGDEERFAAIRAEASTLKAASRINLLALAPTAAPMQAELLAIANENFGGAEGFWDHLWLGQAQFRAGKLDEAVATWEAHRGNQSTWPLLSMTHHQSGNTELARKYLDMTAIYLASLKEMSPPRFADAMIRPGENPSSWLYTVVYYREAKQLIDGPDALAAEEERLAAQQAELRLERTARAEADFQRRIDSAGNDPAPWLRRARWYANRRKHEKAIADCATAIELNPDDARVYVTRANMLFEFARVEQAWADFDTALALAPDDPGVWKARGYVYESLGQWDEALVDYQKAINLAPEDWPSWKIRADNFAQFQQLDQAIALYTSLVTHHSEKWELWQARAAAYVQLNQWDQAIEDYDQAIRLKPEDSTLYMLRGKAYLVLGRYDEALADCDKYVALRPNDAVATLIRAQMLVMADRTEEYRQACKEMLDRFGRSETPGMMCHAARACVLAPKAVSDPTVPIELAARAVSSNPCQWHLYTLGMAHFRAGQLDEAAERFQESLKTEPTWTARFLNWLGLALVHHERGETEKARKSFGEGVELMEQDPGPTSQDRIEGQLLRRKVEQLLGQSEERKDDTESGQKAPVTKPN